MVAIFARVRKQVFVMVFRSWLNDPRKLAACLFPADLVIELPTDGFFCVKDRFTSSTLFL
jgi:hypothetical protein